MLLSNKICNIISFLEDRKSFFVKNPKNVLFYSSQVKDAHIKRYKDNKKKQKELANKYREPYQYAEFLGEDYVSLDEGDVLQRVIWIEDGKDVPNKIELNPTTLVGLGGVNHPYLGCCHVTDDASYWLEKLYDDYGREKESAIVINIYANEGDILLEDPQYAFPDEDGEKRDSKVLITKRLSLIRGKDFIIVE